MDEAPVGDRRDVIIDFSSAEGDRIYLSSIDADGAWWGDQAFIFIGSAPFSDLGQVRFENGILQGHSERFTSVDFEIELKGVTSLTVADLIL
jgi:serralysin